MPTAYRRAWVESEPKFSLLQNTLCFIGLRNCVAYLLSGDRIGFMPGTLNRLLLVLKALSTHQQCALLKTQMVYLGLFFKPRHFFLGIVFNPFAFAWLFSHNHLGYSIPLPLLYILQSASVASGPKGGFLVFKTSERKSYPKRDVRDHLVAPLQYATKKDLEEKPFLIAFARRFFILVVMKLNLYSLQGLCLAFSKWPILGHAFIDFLWCSLFRNRWLFSIIMSGSFNHNYKPATHYGAKEPLVLLPVQSHLIDPRSEGIVRRSLEQVTRNAEREDFPSRETPTQAPGVSP